MHKTPQDRPDPAAQTPAERPASARSRITNGSGLLPTVDQRSAWGRLFRDLVEGLADHVGGPDRMSEPERMTIRRCAALETELVHLESKFANLRAGGGEPSAADLDLYGRLANGQRRHLETLGITRRVRDVVPDLRDYVEGQG